MTQNAMQATNMMDPTPDANIWRRRTANGDALWSWITWAFAIYWVLFAAGAILKIKALNEVGGILVLGVLAFVLIERLWIRLDSVVLASLAAAVVIPLAQVIASTPPTLDALSKHVSLCLVMAVSRVLWLPVVAQSKMRWWLAAQLGAILLISMTVFKGTSWDGGTRHSGLFINPNNLALTPFILLFFIDAKRDKWFVRVAVHAVVVAALAFSGTSGATVAYAIGLAVHLTSMVSKKSRSIVYGLAVVGALVGVVFLAAGGERLLPNTRLTNQITVMRTQIANVIEGVDIAYYAQEKVLGSGSGSAIWRVEHWRQTITTYAAATLPEQIVGLGIGSSPGILGKLPHNEYLRLLFEQGIVGFFLFYFAWVQIVRTAPAEIRYIALIVAIYSFSENNLDNFPFMSMFALCLSARSVSKTVQATVTQPLAYTWEQMFNARAIASTQGTQQGSI